MNRLLGSCSVPHVALHGCSTVKIQADVKKIVFCNVTCHTRINHSVHVQDPGRLSPTFCSLPITALVKGLGMEGHECITVILH